MSDGRRRCPWGESAPEYVAYHDEEWGRPVTDDQAIYERIVLEGFQSGLSWLTILRKREGFRAAFADFDIETVARFGKRDVARLLADAAIVRHRGKIEAAIANAKAAVALDVGLAELVWSARPERAAPCTAAAGRRAGDHPGVDRTVEGAQAPRLPFRRSHDRVRRDAGVRHRQRPPGRLLGARRGGAAATRCPGGCECLVKLAGASSSTDRIRAPRARSRLIAWVHLAVLWSLRVRQAAVRRAGRLAGVLRRAGNTRGDILIFSFALLLLVPTADGRSSRRLFVRLPVVRRTLHLVFVGVLAAALALQIADDALGASSAVLIAIAAGRRRGLRGGLRPGEIPAERCSRCSGRCRRSSWSVPAVLAGLRPDPAAGRRRGRHGEGDVPYARSCSSCSTSSTPTC